MKTEAQSEEWEEKWKEDGDWNEEWGGQGSYSDTKADLTMEEAHQWAMELDAQQVAVEKQTAKAAAPSPSFEQGEPAKVQGGFSKE